MFHGVCRVFGQKLVKRGCASVKKLDYANMDVFLKNDLLNPSNSFSG
jgi:hypothetical protein